MPLESDKKYTSKSDFGRKVWCSLEEAGALQRE
jgi:hypothetical protein